MALCCYVFAATFVVKYICRIGGPARSPAATCTSGVEKLHTDSRQPANHTGQAIKKAITHRTHCHLNGKEAHNNTLLLPTHARPPPATHPHASHPPKKAGANDDNSVAQWGEVHVAARPLNRNASTHRNAGGALCQKYGSQQVNDKRQQQQVKANISVAFWG